MRIDLHTHALPASADARMSLTQLAAAAAHEDVDGVAVTDHSPGIDFAEAERAFAEHGLAFIPAREVSCDLGHVLVLTTDRDWLAALAPRVDLPLAGARGPVACVWAHPAGWRVGGAMIAPEPARGVEHLHGVEVLNGERLYQARGVEIAIGIADAHGLAKTGGSDAHDPAAVGRCLTDAPAASDALSFVEALRAGEVVPVLSQRWGTANGMKYEREDMIVFLG